MDKSSIISDYLTAEQALTLLHELASCNGSIQEIEILHRGGPVAEIRGFVSDNFEPIQSVLGICSEVIEVELIHSRPDDVKFCITYRLQ